MIEFSTVQIQTFVTMLGQILAPYGYKIVPIELNEDGAVSDVPKPPPKPKPKPKGLRSVTALLKK